METIGLIRICWAGNVSYSDDLPIVILRTRDLAVNAASPSIGYIGNSQGRGPELNTVETEGQMLQRACGDLMGIKNIVVLNDEAHHCYREKPQADDGEKLKGEEKEEAKKNNEAARLWISGIETVKRKLSVAAVYDLSATPSFLRGSGYAEGTLFPWTVCDFSLMDTIESGIVKLPRVPIADNIPGGDMPKFRELWKHVGPKMPKKGRGKSGELDPLSLPAELQTALEALYGHYVETVEEWEKAGIDVPPGVHRRVQQQVNLEARLRLHLGFQAQERRRDGNLRRRTFRAVPQLRRIRGTVRSPAHVADR